jgi:class 3 adenylate cyclase/tetratricopeptide (TPR) repeat protein
MTCPECGSENEAGRKFCGECGSSLAAACPECGAQNAPGTKFCGECGASLGAARPVPAREQSAERRLVSVLFVDLVGFTAASEGRDAEETRELLTRYFELARTTVERYGGVVEKFIGDAVMALWGAPVAQEDDPERAVRAALDLVASVPQLDPALTARAGLLTGEAAVTMGAEGHGMVAGDLVNTASRIQSIADPGSVLVGDATKRAAEAAVTFEDAGSHELKGREEEVHLWRAMRVVAGTRGSLRAAGLEAPFVGRDRELRLVKELFHASGEESRAQLMLISGVAGIGKSRLAWEFEKYIDGLVQDVFWHRGRCLSYGDGVAYWALAEMVRMRCEIAEEDDADSARQKLRTALEEHVPDDEERRWVEPRLAHLLGLEEGAPGDSENLFSAWRILFERLSEQSPTVLVFEDLQWADAGLLDFVEYLLEWSRSHPLFVLALARPEFAEKRSAWAAKRSFTQLYLEPLLPAAMDELLTGLVPGLPDDLRARILERAEGVPLYAVETARMLLDRGLVERDGDVYRPTGPVEQLEVPESLHALVASRLDGLASEERRLVQDGAVLGKTFTKQGLSSLTGIPTDELEPLLSSLLRKEILSVQADPRSPERGQYAFLQDIVKRVAYDTLSLRERKAKHLAAARFLLAAGGEEDEFVEVVAAHYLDALKADRQADDADEIRRQARDMLIRAAERAASLAANAEAQRSFERAAELEDDPQAKAELVERAGLAAWTGVRPEEATRCFKEAISLFHETGAMHSAARVEAKLGEVSWSLGRLEESLSRMDEAFQLLAREEPNGDLATLAAQLGRFMFFIGDSDVALERTETALEISERLLLPDVMAEALITKGIALGVRGRRKEALALVRFGLETALENDKPSAALRASYNLADMLAQADRYDEAAATVRDGLSRSRRVGNRYWEMALLGQIYPFVVLGEWDEARSMIEQLPIDEWELHRHAFAGLLFVYAVIETNRGQFDRVTEILDLFASMADSADVQERGSYYAGQARLLLAQGRPQEALEAAEQTFGGRSDLGIVHESVKEAFVAACEAALALDDRKKLEELVGIVEGLGPGETTHFLRAQSARFRAHLAADAGEADRLFRGSLGLLQELTIPFSLAVVKVEYAELLSGQGRADEAAMLLAEARGTFEQLEATLLLERVGRVDPASRNEVLA